MTMMIIGGGGSLKNLKTVWHNICTDPIKNLTSVLQTFPIHRFTLFIPHGFALKIPFDNTNTKDIFKLHVLGEIGIYMFL